MTRFSHAIARTPAPTFAQGLTTASLGTPDYGRALHQHERYCEALRAAGVAMTILAADDRFPDSTFVEDTAVVSVGRAIVTRPGAASRLDEVASMREPLSRFFSALDAIEPPGTLDGGDVCESDGHVYIGLSHRTNASGAEQLAAWFEQDETPATIIDIRDMTSILHLKSGLSYVGDGYFVAIDELIPRLDIPRNRIIATVPEEEYGANCVRVNDVVLLAAGHPRLQAELAAHRLVPVVLDMSEYRKMDGGLSCLSIRF